MGLYLNPGNENFKEVLCQYIYVDKSMLIHETNRLMDRGRKYICMSRPRRFGKTIADNMLAAYYSKGCDSSRIFSHLKIATESDYEEELNKYNVIQIDLNSEYQNTKDNDNLIGILTDVIKDEMNRVFPEVSLSVDDTLARCIQKIHSLTSETFIFQA